MLEEPERQDAPVGGVEIGERLLQYHQLRGKTRLRHMYAHDILRAPWVRECVRHCIVRGGYLIELQERAPVNYPSVVFLGQIVH